MASWLPWVRARRRRVRSTPLSPDHRAILDETVPLAAHLRGAPRERFEGLVQLFLHEKTFEGLAGLEVTDTIRLTVAGTACLLLVGLDEVDVPYPGLDVLRIYPSAYRAAEPPADPWSTWRPSAGTITGESSRRGYVVLAWDHALQGALHPHSGDNVILHEFAHQLDAIDGAADGAPILPEGRMYAPWARILGGVFAELRASIEDGSADVLDPYAATNPAEFFAVATEVFFERPHRLQREHPRLYEMMQRYYRQDPAAWSPG